MSASTLPTELTVLALAALMQVVQYILMAIPVNLQLGPRYTGGSRDEQRLPSGMAGRLFRALNNHFEALILFTIAAIVVTLAEASTPFTQGCAWVYLIARVLYVPAYVSGVFLLRSLIWSVGFVATVLMLLAVLMT
ncbi:MAG: MAPEG family protein [Pseudomonadota bacterium]